MHFFRRPIQVLVAFAEGEVITGREGEEFEKEATVCLRLLKTLLSKLDGKFSRKREKIIGLPGQSIFWEKLLFSLK